MRRRTAPGNSPAERHRAWLELVDIDGPFLAVPALVRVWPQGMPAPDTEAVAALKEARPAFETAWEKWDQHRDNAAALAAYQEARDTWVEVMLRDVLGWGEHFVTDLAGTAAATAARGVRSPDHSVTVTPTGALVHGETVGALVLVVDPVDSLRETIDDSWALSPIDRMEELLRTAEVPIGVVTDGRWWAIVSARERTMLASGVVDAHTFIEEPPTRNAFLELLRPERILAGPAADRLTALFGESVAAAEQITEALGVQVRRAVELLVQALSESARETLETGEPDPLPARRASVYEAAVTVMMRVVFLLFAEERGLLPQGRLFAAGYGISGELETLERRTGEESDEALDATFFTWHRLLATSQALYGGASFEDLRLPSYGGSLFDPSRNEGFLTVRSERGTLAVTVSDRAMLEVLRAVQIARLPGEPARPISFRDIDVEQIGYIYEGLLGYTSEQVDEVTVGLIGNEGEEPELTLAELDDLAEAHPEDHALADAIRARVAETQPAAEPPTKAKLVKALRAGDTAEDAERALLAVTVDAELRTRLRPYLGIIRRDLRGRPLVVSPGGVVVVETPSRATAGAHYTPRSLAEEVVKHALHPLMYERGHGPHDTPDQDAWRPLSSEGILELKVADIACGSGAFLVAAARFLAERLVAAWHREQVAIGPAGDLHTRALRKVVANCLYGADINAMAVEMCKLSLWLVSLDPKLPFSFVDDKVLHGNSLLGLTDLRQLEAMHIDPSIPGRQRTLSDLDIDGVIRQAIGLRRSMATEVDDADPQRSSTTKRRQLRQYEELTAQLADVADGVIAVGLRLGGKPGRRLNEAYENLQIAVGDAYPADGSEPDHRMLDEIREAGLTPTVPTDYERWKPLHWCLAVPDVMQNGGFDAVVGNPPFRGGQLLSGDLGSNVRDWIVNRVAFGKSGSADVVAYFFLRAFSMLKGDGYLGLIASKTIAQGDTREVGLDRLVEDGFDIVRSLQSRRWPVGRRRPEFATVWGRRGRVAREVSRLADGIGSEQISTLLEPVGRASGAPLPLKENSGLAFKGCTPLGMGFVVPPARASQWIEQDSSNADVLFPYLNGRDLNSLSSIVAPRWIVDFGDRTEAEARNYSLPYNHVLLHVKPKRVESANGRAKEEWWLFERRRPALKRAKSKLDHVIALTQTSATQVPLKISARQVFDQKLVVFAAEDSFTLGVLSSSVHRVWAACWGSTRTGDPVYTPSDVFETFPRPDWSDSVTEVGQTLDTERLEIMQRRDLGLTKLYNLIDDPDIDGAADGDVRRLREVHLELDHAVMAAYGWDDVPLDHGFHIYRQMQRWTVSPAARVEILDRLLEENHRRAAAQGEASPADHTEDEGADA